ncbi:hypothetical protein AALA22_04590 [Anaerovoracaceae bacterium 41-7]
MEAILRKFESEGKAAAGGIEISYKTCCGDYPVYGEDRALLGTMFTYSYVRTDVESSQDRPVIFAFNGGPGSSALWLHTGLLAPKRIRLENPTAPQTVPPFELEENPNCFLDLCDVVIIDPMGTGWSQIIEETRQAEAYSYEKDGEIFARFIEDWIRKENRWASPKYLMGESYGTMRACVIPSILMGGPICTGAVSKGITIDGIIMMGTGLNVNPQPNWWDEYGVEKMVLDLPTMAACNWYFNREEKPDLHAFIAEADAFAGKELLAGLYRGNRMTEAETKSFIEKLTYFTGLSPSYLKKKNDRISLSEFSKELLGDEGQEIGMYDGRFVMHASGQIGMADPVADDGAMGRYTPAFRGGFLKLAEELGIDIDMPYHIINFNVNGMWKFDGIKTPLEYLRAALRRNPSLRVLLTNGVYDLVTTIGQARYAAGHLDAEKGQVILREYPSGHMSYVGEESGEKLSQDIRDFIEKEEMESCY